MHLFLFAILNAPSNFCNTKRTLRSFKGAFNFSTYNFPETLHKNLDKTSCYMYIVKYDVMTQ